MLKKVFLSICAIVVIAYLSLWAWAVHWIDNQHDEFAFYSNEKNIVLEIAKTVWKITPAIDRKKDAERVLKISSLSVYTDLKNMKNMIKNLKINYDFISEYYKKHENELSDKLKSKFSVQRLIFINRSLGNIKDDDFIHSLFFDLLGFDLKKGELLIYPEIIWYSFINKNNFDKDLSLYKEYWRKFEETVQKVNEEKSTTAFNIISQYHLGTILCYDSNILKTEYSNNSNRRSVELFKIIQKQITTDSYQYKILDNYFHDVSSTALILFPLVFSSKTECEKEIVNFASKMSEIENILDEKNSGHK